MLKSNQCDEDLMLQVYKYSRKFYTGRFHLPRNPTPNSMFHLGGRMQCDPGTESPSMNSDLTAI